MKLLLMLAFVHILFAVVTIHGFLMYRFRTVAKIIGLSPVTMAWRLFFGKPVLTGSAIEPVPGTCTRPLPHLCTSNGPCNGFPRKSGLENGSTD